MPLAEELAELPVGMPASVMAKLRALDVHATPLESLRAEGRCVCVVEMIEFGRRMRELRADARKLVELA